MPRTSHEDRAPNSSSGRFWWNLGPSWAALGQLWATLGCLLAPLGRVLGPLGHLLTGLWRSFTASWRPEATPASIFGGFGTCQAGFWTASEIGLACFLLCLALRYISFLLLQ